MNIKEMQNNAALVINEVKKAFIGKDDIIIKVLTAILAKGHILIEDIPGVGKTTLAIAFSKVMDLSHKRMQFTPDVLPADITGFTIYDKNSGEFLYKEGAAVCNLFLADEINRASPKTQSALLEIMEEGQITVDGVTKKVPVPYTVIATQNPLGSIGTQQLPESQIDRFMINLSLGYPDTASEIAIAKQKNGVGTAVLRKIIDANQILEMQNAISKIFVHDAIYQYIVDIVTATRKNPYIQLGLSPRCTIALSMLAKVSAFLHGRDYAVPSDVWDNLFICSEHRLTLSARAKMDNMSKKQILRDIASTIKVQKCD